MTSSNRNFERAGPEPLADRRRADDVRHGDGHDPLGAGRRRHARVIAAVRHEPGVGIRTPCPPRDRAVTILDRMGNDPGWSSVASGWDVPDAYVARDRRRALAAGLDLPDRVSGAALFADVSGFTPLAATLSAELGAERGPEELTACLNRVFHAVIERLDAFGGEVIYFSGDAITCWLDGDDGSRAVACALAMQEVMEDVGAHDARPGGSEVRLGMKVAIAVGAARRFVVGDPALQLLDVLAGRLVDDLAAAEQHARRGEVVLDESALEALGDGVVLGERRRDPASGREVAVVAGLRSAREEGPVDEVDPLPEDLVRPWLLPAVYERLRTGRGEFLAELRPGGAAVPALRRHRLRRGRPGRRTAGRLHAPGAARARRPRRQPAAARARRQGREPVRRLRLAALARGRRRPRRRRRARAARPGRRHGRARALHRRHARPPAQRHVRPLDAPHLRLPRRRREPRRAADVGRAAGAIYVEQAVHDAAGEAFAWESLPPFAGQGPRGARPRLRRDAASRGALSRRVRHEGPMVGRARRARGARGGRWPGRWSAAAASSA